jgi:hypothetical protein
MTGVVAQRRRGGDGHDRVSALRIVGNTGLMAHNDGVRRCLLAQPCPDHRDMGRILQVIDQFRHGQHRMGGRQHNAHGHSGNRGPALFDELPQRGCGEEG